jgi:septal ring factor EnvC (AmiA/AmiB activator)
VLIAFLLIGRAAAAPAQTDDKGQELEELKRRISNLTQELQRSQQKQKGVEDELAALDLKIALQNEEVRKIELERSMQSEKVQALAAQVLDLRGTIERQKARLLTKARFLHRLGRLGYLRLFFSDSGSDFLSVLRWALRLAHQDRRLFSDYLANLDRLSRERENLRAGEAALARLQRERAAKLEEMKASEEQKRFLLTQLKRKEKETEAQMAALKEKAARLERLIATLAGAPHERLAKEDIRRYKGALDWPLKGRVTVPFGPVAGTQYATRILSKGIEVTAPAPAEVGPIFPGKVVYARWFKGYSNLVVLDHGFGVISITGFLTVCHVKEGEWVPAGRALGRLTEAPYTYYLEIRDRGTAVDPAPWLR